MWLGCVLCVIAGCVFVVCVVFLHPGFLHFFIHLFDPYKYHTGPHIRGRTYAKKNVFFTQKKSRLRKSENAVRLLYAKNSDHTHQNAFSLFVFCTQQRRFVEHLPWV